MRTCAHCEQRLPNSAFSYFTRAERYDPYCRTCRAEYVRTHPRTGDPQGFVRTTLMLPDDLHAWLVARARTLDLPLRALTAQILSRYRSARLLDEARQGRVRPIESTSRESVDSTSSRAVDSTSQPTSADALRENR